jgi:hypothetical protein
MNFVPTMVVIHTFTPGLDLLSIDGRQYDTYGMLEGKAKTKK